MDVATTKILCIHISSLLPPTSTELDVPHSVQVAAILGTGLVYQKTAHRHLAEVLLGEIGARLSHLKEYWILVEYNNSSLSVFALCHGDNYIFSYIGKISNCRNCEKLFLFFIPLVYMLLHCKSVY